MKFGKVGFCHAKWTQLPEFASGLWLGEQQTPHELTLSGAQHLPSMSRT